MQNLTVSAELRIRRVLAFILKADFETVKPQRECLKYVAWVGREKFQKAEYDDLPQW